MDSFLVNMAVVKVNFDKTGQALLDNYIPLVAYVLKKYKYDVISIEDFKVEFCRVAEFKIPSAAIGTLLKRANVKYGFVKRCTDGTYQINRESLPSSDYEEVRDKEVRKQNALKIKFIEYCKNELETELKKEDVSNYFFQILFEISPLLFKSVSDIDHIRHDDKNKKKYMIGRFISYACENDQTSFEAIESFVRGAMLTETFYYSAPNDVQGKMRSTVVYFDTTFLIKALGICDKKFSEPPLELIEILKTMSVKMRCFNQTRDEIVGILHAASSTLKTRGRLIPKRPGDVFDYYNSIGAKSSDVELDIATIESKLNKIGVFIVDKPPHSTYLTINESALRTEIEAEITFQSEAARNHDIDCLTSIHRLRSGQPKKYLESCDAIFITSNSGLAKASTRYFNRDYGVSDAPVCMPDQVFTTIVWLKAVKKAPDLPRHRLVANCFAALQPSDALWGRYIKEALALKERGQIGEEDYAVLIHSLEARNRLMELTLGEEDNIHGTVEDVLARAKNIYNSELSSELHDAKSSYIKQKNKIDILIEKVEKVINKTVSLLLLFLMFIMLCYSVIKNKPTEFGIESLTSIDALLFWSFSIMTVLNLVFGYYVFGFCKKVGNFISRRFAKALKGLLVA